MDGNALNSACPKDLLYLRQGSSQCHKDLRIAGYPDFRKSTPQSQQYKKMPLVSAVPCTQILDGSIKNSSEEKRNTDKHSQREWQRKTFLISFYSFPLLSPSPTFLCAVLASFLYLQFPILPFIYVHFNFFLLLNHISSSSMNMVSRLSQYISMHLAWLKEGHLRAGMDDLATTKFKLLALLTGYFPCLYSLVYCTWSQHVCANSYIHISVRFIKPVQTAARPSTVVCCPPK